MNAIIKSRSLFIYEKILARESRFKLMIPSYRAVNLLKKCILKQNPSFIELIKENNLMDLNDEQIHALRDFVCDELIQEGFVNWEITPYGMELEELIDYLGSFIM